MGFRKMTEFKKYRNKETGEEVEAKFHNDEIGGCWIIQRDIDPFISDKDFKRQYQLIENENDK